MRANLRVRVCGGLIAATLIALAAITSTPAHAATTRAEYVAQVDPICQAWIKPGTKTYAGFRRANRKLYLQTKRGVPQRKAYGRYFPRIARLFAFRLKTYSATTAQIARVAPPPGDETLIGDWLEKRAESASLLRRSITAAHHRNFSDMAKFFEFSNLAEIQGEEPLAGFGFRYCVEDD